MWPKKNITAKNEQVGHMFDTPGLDYKRSEDILEDLKVDPI